MKLYELSEAFEAVLNDGMFFDTETGEVLFDESNLDALEMALDEKLRNCGCYIKDMEADAFALDREIKALQARKKAAVGRVSRMKDYVVRCMETAGRTKFETPEVAFSQRSSSYVDVMDETVVPEDYKVIEEVTKVDKNAVKAAIKSGQAVPGCDLKSRVSLQVR